MYRKKERRSRHYTRKEIAKTGAEKRSDWLAWRVSKGRDLANGCKRSPSHIPFIVPTLLLIPCIFPPSHSSAVFRTESSPRILQSSLRRCCISGMPASCASRRCFSSVKLRRVAVSSCSKRQPPSPSNCSRWVWYFLEAERARLLSLTETDQVTETRNNPEHLLSQICNIVENPSIACAIVKLTN